MRKFMLSSALAVALSVGVTAAQADNPAHPNHGHHHSQSPTQSHRCGVVQKGFIVYGDYVSNGATQPTPGNWSGPLTITVTRVNHHAKKASVDPLPFTQLFTLNNTKAIFVGVTDTNAPSGVGFEDLTAGPPADHVKLIGKIAYAKKGGHGDHACTNPVTFNGHQIDPGEYDTLTNAIIRQVVVHRAPTP